MTHVTSRDGTRITFEQLGDGPPLILVGGAFNDRNARAAGRPLAELLASRFTVIIYDRRGRGSSGDTAPYAVAREVEDLDALIAHAGGQASAYGMSSGAALILHAVGRGLSLTKLVLYEPPFAVDADAGERARRYSAELADAVASGRNGDAAVLFMEHVGVPPAMIDRMRGSPMWAGLEALAPTLAYDSEVMGDRTGSTVPDAALATILQPTLVVCGGASPDWMRVAGQKVADALPNGDLVILDGQTHDVAPDALAPVLIRFLSSQT